LTSTFTVQRPAPHQPLNIQFNWPGRHNALNALAAIAVATELGVSDEKIVSGLLHFAGVGRRFQMLGERAFAQGKALVIDDYGHHPREIKATIEALRAVWPNRRLVHVFQPHRYTRTRDLFNDFVDVLKMSDELLLLNIYSAGESVIPGINSEVLLNEIHQSRAKATLVADQHVHEHLNKVVLEGDVILMQGAGSVGQLAINLMAQ
jgi:UDP-N-acetylmuramate--alanine ligase